LWNRPERGSVYQLPDMLHSMTDCSNWVPMRWPDTWRTAQLDLLKGSAINCLVLPWGKEKPPSQFLDAARSAGLALVGLFDPAADRNASLESAYGQKLDAVALENPDGVKLPAIAWAEKTKLPFASNAAAFAFSDAVWPAVPTRPDEAEAGPTGVPWVDSNGWLIQLVRTLAPGKPVWSPAVPPKTESFIRTVQYQLAVADAFSYGARWVVTPDEKLRDALAAGKQAARDMWGALNSSIRFFRSHASWEALPPYGNIGVLSDFSGPNAYVSLELLNLLPRRTAFCVIVEKKHAAARPLSSLNGIIYPDDQLPAEPLLRQLGAFAVNGGVLVAPTKWPAPNGVAPVLDPFKRWNVYQVGKGRVAIAKEEVQDPYLLASDAQLLISREHDLVHLFNSSAINVYYTAPADGKTAVLHVNNYGLGHWLGPLSVGLTKPYRSASMWKYGLDKSLPLEVIQADRGIELHLPPFGVYAAIELEA